VIAVQQHIKYNNYIKHFTFGSNQHDTAIGDINWSLAIANECGLKKTDFFIPKRVLLIK
jgi:hypothetical protein